MEDCVVCCVRAVYICKPCNGAFCKEHKILHQKGKKREHVFKKLGKKFSAQQLAEIVEKLSSNIKVTDQCRTKIIEESMKLL